jgi:predicted metal-dependent phosphoesterase TrpH
MKVDFHLHSNHSFDAWSSVRDIARHAHKAGLGAVALTDHGEFSGCGALAEYSNAHNLDLTIIPGMEIDTEFGEVLGLFLTEKIGSKVFAEACDEIHSQGGFAVIPHPFDSMRGHALNPENLSGQELSQVDGIETFNARCSLPSMNKKAVEFALTHGIKLTTAGSDAHFPFEIGAAYGEIPDGMGIDIAMRKGLVVPHGHHTPPLVHGPTSMLKFARKAGILRPKI